VIIFQNGQRRTQTVSLEHTDTQLAQTRRHHIQSPSAGPNVHVRTDYSPQSLALLIYQSNPQELVTFNIGSGTAKKIFLVLKEVATIYSPVLHAAFRSDFLEGKTQSYTLEDVEPELFKLMVQWLYGQKLEYFFTQADVNSLRANPNNTEEERNNVHGKIEERQRLFVRLWVLADRLAIPRLQNLVADELESIRCDWDESVAWRCLSYVYENTAERSTLKWLLLNQCFRSVSPCLMADDEDHIPKKFLLDTLTFSHLGTWIDLGDRERFRSPLHVPVEDGGEEDGSPGIGAHLDEVM